MQRLCLSRVLVFLFVCFAGPIHLAAQQVGDIVAVVRDTEIKMGDNVVGTLRMGETPIIQAINGDWLWVDYGANQLGWIQKQDIETLEAGIQRFTEMIRQDPTDDLAYTSRGLIWAEKGEYDIAIKDFTDVLRLHPDAIAYCNRGWCWIDKGDYDKAIADLDEAIRLDPTYALAVSDRARVWRYKNEYDKAIADYNQAIQLTPNDTAVYCGRGLAWEGKGQYDKAIADYDRALQINPRCSDAYGNLAYLQASCPDAKYRDGKKALENARQACEASGWKDSWNVDAMAAAHAESGDFAKALEYEAKALKLARTDREKKAFTSRQELYRQKKPYRQEAKK